MSILNSSTEHHEESDLGRIQAGASRHNAVASCVTARKH